MKTYQISAAVLVLVGLAACTQQSGSGEPDSCGASAYESFLGGPSSAVFDLDIPGTSRHYGSAEAVATDNPSRLNFVHSGTAIEAVADPSSRVVQVFCG